MANEYAALDDLKRLRRIENDEDDAALNRVLTTASRRIDQRCDRRFFADTVASAREYELAGRTVWERGKPGELLLIADFYTIIDLVVEVGDGFNWTVVPAGTYKPDPLDAIELNWPFEALRRHHSAWSTGAWFVSHARVTAKWGWAEVPPAIEEATLLEANRLYLRKDSPEGVAGSTEWGLLPLRRLDPDVEDLIQPFLAHGAGGVG